jgi:DNA-binding MarR family transcriptional regulator
MAIREKSRKCYGGVVTTEENAVAAWRSLLLAQNAVLRAIDEDLAAAGAVPLTVYDVLLELNAAPARRLRLKELAARTVLTRSRVSKLVDELVADGFVARTADPADARASVVVLTADGRRALKHGAPIYLAGIARHFTSHITAAEAATVTRALQRVLDAHTTKIEARASR